ncbi:hypothetical protein DENSPDRAFT_758298, partial [Dentipellis sp. KUC8613]
GSIYVLVLIAGLDLKHEAQQLSGISSSLLVQLLRHPPSGSQDATGLVLSNKIIPAVAYLRQILPMNLTALFSSSDLASWGLNFPIDASNLEASDKFFDTI